MQKALILNMSEMPFELQVEIQKQISEQQYSPYFKAVHHFIVDMIGKKNGIVLELTFDIESKTSIISKIRLAPESGYPLETWIFDNCKNELSGVSHIIIKNNHI